MNHETTNLKTIPVHYMGSCCVIRRSNLQKKNDIETNKHKPKADFTFTVKNQGSLPDTVSFTSTSTNATLLSWNFDNGTTSTLSNPDAIYTQPGTYNVKLIVVNKFGIDSIIKQVIISISANKPTAGFTFTLDNNGQVPSTATFTNTSTNASTYKWYFSSSDTSNTTNVQRLFNIPKTYSVKLVAMNAAGSDSVTKEVTVNPIMKSVVVYLITPRDNQFN